jgi:hypothetical protein
MCLGQAIHFAIERGDQHLGHGPGQDCDRIAVYDMTSRPRRRTLSQSPGVHDHELAQTRHSERG